MFDSRLKFKTTPPRVFSHVCIGSHTFAMVYAHALREKRGIPAMHAHIMLTTFTRFTQNSTVVSMLALYGSTMYTVCHVATLQS